MISSPIAVIGAGSWGTALAILLARNGNAVHLWGNLPAEMQPLIEDRENKQYLPGIPFPENLRVHLDLSTALADVSDILIVVPSHAFRSVLHVLKPHLHDASRLVWATKGLEPETDLLPHQILAEELGDSYPSAVISGPSFAKEVALNLPTAVGLAASETQFAEDLKVRFLSERFHLSMSDDMVGVQLCGAVKNVLAIATGIADGKDFGANTRAALITCGLKEMIALGEKLGAKKDTFISFSGIGDLVLTATDNQSRNRRFGLALGKGGDAQTIEKDIGQVVEGVKNALQVHRLAEKYQVEMPVCHQVYRILYENASVESGVEALLKLDK